MGAVISKLDVEGLRQDKEHEFKSYQRLHKQGPGHEQRSGYEQSTGYEFKRRY